MRHRLFAALRGAIHTGDRGRVIVVIAMASSIVLAATLERFATYGNLFAILRSVSVIGVMALGMTIAVIGRNIDLSQVAIAVISTGTVVKVLGAGWPLAAAAAIGLGAAVAMSVVNAAATAIAGIPPLFATLATSLLFVGIARTTILPGASIFLPHGHDLLVNLGGTIGGIPVPPLVFAGVALAAHFFLECTVPGRFIRAVGINPETATVIGLPVGPLNWLQYLVSAMTAFVGGLLMLASSGLVDLRAASSTMIFDVVMIVVLGGASLSGGQGTIFGVVAATIFVGIALNAMTIIDVGAEFQSIVKGVALLVVITADRFLHRPTLAGGGH